MDRYYKIEKGTELYNKIQDSRKDFTILGKSEKNELFIYKGIEIIISPYVKLNEFKFGYE